MTGLLRLMSGGAEEGDPSDTICEIGARCTSSLSGAVKGSAARCCGPLRSASPRPATTRSTLVSCPPTGPVRGSAGRGGSLHGHVFDDEEGYQLPLTIYAWSAITELPATERVRVFQERARHPTEPPAAPASGLSHPTRLPEPRDVSATRHGAAWRRHPSGTRRSRAGRRSTCCA